MSDKDRRAEYIKYFEKHDGLGVPYLLEHAHRFLCTHDLVVAGLDKSTNPLILDVASHWLHNAYLYTRDGFRVIALDQEGGAISTEVVNRFADGHGIKLLPCKALSDPIELDTALADDSVDVVMFTETIEHITFNPVNFWSQIYKKLKVGGKIVITTPNYFYYRGAFARDVLKVLCGSGSGISIYDILHAPDYSPHWKEFSSKDMYQYFGYLSSDFRITRLLYNNLYGRAQPGLWFRLCRKLAPKFFHRTMYIEVELTRKEAGIQAVPHY